MKLIQYFNYIRYPQFNWAVSIYNEIKKILPEGNSVILDAPCGDGIISYWLSNKKLLNGAKYELIDISESCIGNIRKWSCLKENFVVEQSNLLDYYQKTDHNNNIWLIINSLYLFNNPEKLINWGKANNKFIIGIFPYIDRENYKLYLQNKDHIENPSALTLDDTIEFFKRNGFDILHKSELTYFTTQCSSNRIIKAIRKRILVFFEYLFSVKHGNYWLGVFERRD